MRIVQFGCISVMLAWCWRAVPRRSAACAFADVRRNSGEDSLTVRPGARIQKPTDQTQLVPTPPRGTKPIGLLFQRANQTQFVPSPARGTKPIRCISAARIKPSARRCHRANRSQIRKNVCKPRTILHMHYIHCARYDAAGRRHRDAADEGYPKAQNLRNAQNTTAPARNEAITIADMEWRKSFSRLSLPQIDSPTGATLPHRIEPIQSQHVQLPTARRASSPATRRCRWEPVCFYVPRGTFTAPHPPARLFNPSPCPPPGGLLHSPHHEFSDRHCDSRAAGPGRDHQPCDSSRS
jgi:hypothetical protein